MKAISKEKEGNSKIKNSIPIGDESKLTESSNMFKRSVQVISSFILFLRRPFCPPPLYFVSIF